MRSKDLAGFGPVGTNGDAAASCKSEPVFVADCDQEAWVHARILDAIKLASDLRASARDLPSANRGAVSLAIDAIAGGTAVEIIRTLGGEPCFVNLPKVRP